MAFKGHSDDVEQGRWKLCGTCCAGAVAWCIMRRSRSPACHTSIRPGCSPLQAGMSLLPLRAEVGHLGAPFVSLLTQGICPCGTLHFIPFFLGWQGMNLRMRLDSRAADFSQESIQVQLVPLGAQVGNFRQHFIINCVDTDQMAVCAAIRYSCSLAVGARIRMLILYSLKVTRVAAAPAWNQSYVAILDAWLDPSLPIALGSSECADGFQVVARTFADVLSSHARKNVAPVAHDG